MKRRDFIKIGALGSLSTPFYPHFLVDKTHILTLSFDDGFKKSFYKIADLYEFHGLSACFNVIASGHLPRFEAVDHWILPKLMGDFDDWNALQERGHEVMPHSWRHLNLAKQSTRKSKRLIVKCLEYFEKNLEGFDAKESVFNFPFNASTPALEAFTLSKVMAIRSWGGGALNTIPIVDPYLMGCASNGPNNIDQWVEKQINDFLAKKSGWLILNLHGLDDEGWGPISTTFLKRLLKRLVKIEELEIAPTGRVIKRARKK